MENRHIILSTVKEFNVIRAYVHVRHVMKCKIHAGEKPNINQTTLSGELGNFVQSVHTVAGKYFQKPKRHGNPVRFCIDTKRSNFNFRIDYEETLFILSQNQS